MLIRSRTGALLVIGQLCLFVGLGVAVALHPGFVLKADEGGISNYGVHLETFLPYTFAFAGCATCSVLAARRSRGSGAVGRQLSVLLGTYGAVLVATLLSTYLYKLGDALRLVHDGIGGVTLAFEFGAALWLFARLRTRTDAALLVGQAVGSALAALTAAGALHLLFVGQAMASVGFGLLLIRVGVTIPDTDLPRPGSSTVR